MDRASRDEIPGWPGLMGVVDNLNANPQEPVINLQPVEVDEEQKVDVVGGEVVQPVLHYANRPVMDAHNEFRRPSAFATERREVPVYITDDLLPAHVGRHRMPDHRFQGT